MPENRCQNCSAPLAAHALGDHCPRCLLLRGLESNASGSYRDTLGQPPRAGSVLETISSTVGTVPHVLLRDTAIGEEPSPIARPMKDTDATLRYRIDGEIARGGMGRVLKGRDPDLGRDVALKVLREDLRENTDLVRRFVEEAQIGGQLQHSGIVPIYELGTFADKRPFFSMKLVKGQTLADLLVARSAPTEDLPRFLSIFASIAQTMAYAHTRGVIHRDLKPSNVMVGSFGEVQVMDWGLAKVLHRGGVVADAKAGKEPPPETMIATARSGSDAELSHAGSILGTPSYMAPEKARGETEAINERADVFALGSILCEILTGSPAFRGRTSGEIVRKAVRGETADALPRLEVCGAEAELIALAKECLAVEPEDRPRDANDVSERITAYLAGVQERLRATELARAAESARAEEAIVRVGAERRARRFQVGLAASLLLLTIAGGLGLTYYLQQRQAGAARVASALKEATLLRDQAVANHDDPARWPAALAGVKRADAALAEGGDPAARQQLAALGQEVQAGADAAERDKQLLVKLVDIRSAQPDEPSSATDAAYAAAFRAAGIDLDALEPKAAGARIAARPEPVRLAMVAALDHWTGVRKARGQGETWRKIVAVARAADPDPDRDALRAALAVEDKAKRLEQIRPLAAKADATTWSPASLALLASTLAGAGDMEAAVRVLRRASGVHPTDAWVHHMLGLLLEKSTPPRREEAIQAYAAARALRPETGHELAHALEKTGRSEEAEAVFRDLVSRRPEIASHLTSLAIHLKGRGRDDEAGLFLERAIAAGRKAIELDPKHALAPYNLGIALAAKGQFDEAIACYRTAIELDPKHATTHVNLGVTLAAKGQFDEAIACYRTAITLDPKSAMAHSNLGGALWWAKGQLDDAIAAWRRATELGSKTARPLLAQADRAAAARDKFADFENGRYTPATTGERLGMAAWCQTIKRNHTATRLYADTFAADPKLAADLEAGQRYNAACAAAMAAAGQHEDAEKTRLRKQPLDWLRADLALWTKQLESGQPADRAEVPQWLWRWKQETDLAAIRDAAALAKLPVEERTACEQLWTDVAALLKRAQEGTSTTR
jgi:eukaryotic-like serine/threonine-protein kinase